MSDRLPVVAWQLAPTLAVARTALRSWDEVSAAHASVKAAGSDVRDRVQEEGAHSLLTEEVELAWVAVTVRPRILPTTKSPRNARPKARQGGFAEAVSLKVPVVLAPREEGGGRAEVLCTGDVLHYDKRAELPGLVEHVIREALAWTSPEELWRRLLLPVPELLRLACKDPEDDARRRPPPPPLPETLKQVADVVRGLPPGAMGVWEREDDLQHLGWQLFDGQRSALVVGAPRVGKTSLIAEAARRHRGVRVWHTQAGRLTARSPYLGQWQQQVDRVIDELESTGDVLWVEDLPELAAIGGDDPSSSVAAYLLPALRAGRIKLVGEATPEVADRLRLRFAAFADRLETFTLGPLDGARLAKVAELARQQHKQRAGVEIGESTGRLAVRLLDRFLRREQFPGKLVDLLAAAVTEAKSRQLTQVDDALLLQVLSRQTGLPAVLVDDRQALDPDELQSWFDARIQGQPDAVRAVVDVVSTFKAGLADPGHPLATLLFAGPTGVGKTATARALAAWAFGAGMKEAPLVRLDMSEYQSPTQIDKLLGTSDGQPSELVRRVREHPFCVVLLDEIEKASPVFFDTLLGVLDQGTLTDARGRVVDFRNAVVILTTNLGVRSNAAPGFGGSSAGFDTSAIRAFFRPELLNRIDRVVAFRPLSADSIRKIAELELAAIELRPGVAQRGISLLFAPEVVDRVVRAGYDPLLGARPLQRAVEQLVVAAVARYLLEHRDAMGTLVVEVVEGDVVVH
jgi:ATP-dependent Clp protease ATP-binding subunit ClpC